MRFTQPTMRPLDIVVLLKIVAYGETPWLQQPMAVELIISQSELSKSMARSKYAGLLDEPGKEVRCLALMEFLEHGVAYAFPQQPGSMVRGIPTAHSASPIKEHISSGADVYVWPYVKGNIRGQAIEPLYKTIAASVHDDKLFYELLVIIDTIRVGRVREISFAIEELEKRLLHD